MKRLEKDLNKIILEALYSPSFDPRHENLTIASIAYKYLKDFNLLIENEENVLEILSGHNVYSKNYL